jgi:hypothetical protein
MRFTMTVSRLIIVWSTVVISLVTAITFVLGFRRDQPKLVEQSSRPGSRIFKGFAYAGIRTTARPIETNIRSVLPFKLATQPLPIRFVSGHCYVFHHPAMTADSYSLAKDVLAPRLWAEGFAIDGDQYGIFLRFATLDFAGGGGFELWEIRFKRGACTCVIQHDTDLALQRNPWPVMRKTWENADYNLYLQGECNL